MVQLPISIAQPTAPRGEGPWRAANGPVRRLTVMAALGMLVVLALAPRSVVLLLVAPVLEEIVFRLGLQQRLLTAGSVPMAANLLTALAFGLVHAFSRNWALGVAVLLPALAIGWIYQRRRSVLPCIAAHAGMNLVWLLLIATWPALASRIT